MQTIGLPEEILAAVVCMVDEAHLPASGDRIGLAYKISRAHVLYDNMHNTHTHTHIVTHTHTQHS